MPGFVLHAGASVLCAHNGSASPTVPSPRVRVGGEPATTMSGPYTVAGCPFNVSGSPVPCVTAQWLIGATRITAGGMPVLLQTSVATCAPTATPLNIILTQTRVSGL